MFPCAGIVCCATLLAENAANAPTATMTATAAVPAVPTVRAELFPMRAPSGRRDDCGNEILCIQEANPNLLVFSPHDDAPAFQPPIELGEEKREEVRCHHVGRELQTRTARGHIQ